MSLSPWAFPVRCRYRQCCGWRPADPESWHQKQCSKRAAAVGPSAAGTAGTQLAAHGAIVSNLTRRAGEFLYTSL
jgi:hypothetical protein